MWLITFLALTTCTLRQVSGAPTSDACHKVAGKDFVLPKDAVACLKSFPFNETIKDNVLDVVSKMFDFYTFENYYLNPPAFQDSAVDIRKKIEEIRTATYQTDYEFQTALMNFTGGLNDGHTVYTSLCHSSYLSLLPTPIINIAVNGTQKIFIDFDSVELISQMPQPYLQYYSDIGFDWERYAGAQVLQIEGKDAWDYVDYLADTTVGGYLDQNIRTNGVFTSTRIFNNTYTKGLGQLAATPFLDKDTVTFKLIPANLTAAEVVTVPYMAMYVGDGTFSDSATFWQSNCLATNNTNGIDRKIIPKNDTESKGAGLQERNEIMELDAAPVVISLPQKHLPTVPGVDGNSSVIKFYMLPQQKIGVIIVSSFFPTGIMGNSTMAMKAMKAFQADFVNAISTIKNANMEYILIDLTSNRGGSVCLGSFMQEYLAGSNNGSPGFIFTYRASLMSQKIMDSVIELKVNGARTVFSRSAISFVNGSDVPSDYNIFDPLESNIINGQSDPTSQKFIVKCKTRFFEAIPEFPPFELSKIAIVTNGLCASTCAMFATAMYEKYNTSIAVFGGHLERPIEYKGMAGGSIMLWADMDSEVKTANLKSDSQAAPDLLVNSDMTVNFRNAYSWIEPEKLIAYRPEPPQLHLGYTNETYNNPQKMWEYAAKQIFGI